MTIEEKKQLEKLLFEYRDEAVQKMIKNGSLKNKQPTRKVNDITKAMGHVSLDILEELQRKEKLKNERTEAISM